jgi:AraC family transcriptional regulator of adaptative response/methylated-DNA-[protein]-cysteine methyltransferase
MLTLSKDGTMPLQSPAPVDNQMTDQDRTDTRIQFEIFDWSLGRVLVAATGQGVCAILFDDDADALKADLKVRFPGATLDAGDELFAKLAAAVLDFIENPASPIEFPLDPVGTTFQKRVWRALHDVAPGTTASYKEIAERIGSPKASRAIARACAANPIAVAIPCHRIVRRDGSLSGYRWGTERKRALLDREAQQ